MSIAVLGGNEYNLGVYETATEAKVRSQNGARAMRRGEGGNRTLEEVVEEGKHVDGRNASYTPLMAHDGYKMCVKQIL